MLVIKDNTLDYGEQGVELYRDARANKGTLLLLDFSNSTCISNVGMPIGKEPNNLAYSSVINLDNTFSVDKPLTAKKGLHVSQTTSNQLGLMFRGLGDYLINNPNNEIAVSIWAERSSEIGGTASRFMRAVDNIGMFDLSITASNVSFRIGGASHTQTLSANTDRIVQYIMSCNPATNEARRGFNGSVLGLMSTLPTGYSDMGEIGVGNLESSGATQSPVVLYRMIIEDLTLSGQNVNDFALQDYNYVNAQGLYAGIESRPFSNL
ncbi:hypothetical protein [Weeksella sp. HMSC059D05]|uniref:hypothetical protein n=1 Tax=Weeksella sp. HMSC059D05 TaxID=1715139 RepID=UPI0008A1B2F1|nr:hypothetical protein [Weeksella sp. HMSC059D05]OFM84561.1 hypothetical protein HMPREF2660_08605 [Weeksella sp. HMSC059D05]